MVHSPVISNMQDVWFDSGTSWAGCLDADAALGLPADLYLEGSDQHRGWGARCAVHLLPFRCPCAPRTSELCAAAPTGPCGSCGYCDVLHVQKLIWLTALKSTGSSSTRPCFDVAVCGPELTMLSSSQALQLRCLTFCQHSSTHAAMTPELAASPQKVLCLAFPGGSRARC